MRTALTIAGSDSSGGAGIQADIKTMTANGVFAMSAVTALTAQNTTGVTGIMEVSPEFLKEQIDCIFTDIRPDAVKIGMVSSAELIRAIAEKLKEYKAENIVVDPVMADNGKLYPAFGPEFPAEMAKVCAKADLIVPNLTEASLLTGLPYRTEYDESYIREMLQSLAKLGPRYVALTGVSFEKGRLGVMHYDRERDVYGSYFTEHLPASFHGTGDVFASTCVGGLMRGLPLGEALALAADYTVECIRLTLAAPDAKWYGVEFESAIPYLVGRLS